MLSLQKTKLPLPLLSPDISICLNGIFICILDYLRIYNI